MTAKSAHRDVALWRYERPSAGYRGLHLRARDSVAHRRLRDRLAVLSPGDTHLLRLRETLDDWPLDGRWPATACPDALLVVGNGPTPPETDTLLLAISADEHSRLIVGMDDVSVHAERSYRVGTPEGLDSLWLWWPVSD